MKLGIRVEWPTLVLALAVYSLWLALIIGHAALPLAIILALLTLLTTLHSSLQHEALHGHPTRVAAVNEALVWPALGLFIPYRRFKSLHMRHHRNEALTDPYDDPESFYRAERDWHRLSRPMRWLLTVNNTLIGRLTIGPALALFAFWVAELRHLVRRDRAVIRAWSHHLVSVGLIGGVLSAAGFPIWLYALGVAYPAMALLMLRTFAEHQAHETVDGRTVIVENGALFGLLFLNNHLHFVHHAHPRAAWYELPALYRRNAATYQARNHGYVFKSYLEILRRYGLTPKEPVAHPVLRRN